MSSINQAVQILQRGGIIIFPTDTVWGVGVAADNPAAIKNFYRIKRREKNKPTAILVADLGQAEQWGQFSKKTRQLAGKYWPGALTLVVEGKQGGTVGLRVPNYPVTQDLCRRVGGILAGSANFAGEPAPQRREEISRELGNQVDLVMGGESLGQEASTVIDTTVKPWRIVRQGPVKVE